MFLQLHCYEIWLTCIVLWYIVVWYTLDYWLWTIHVYWLLWFITITINQNISKPYQLISGRKADSCDRSWKQPRGIRFRKISNSIPLQEHLKIQKSLGFNLTSVGFVRSKGSWTFSNPKKSINFHNGVSFNSHHSQTKKGHLTWLIAVPAHQSSHLALARTPRKAASSAAKSTKPSSAQIACNHAAFLAEVLKRWCHRKLMMYHFLVKYQLLAAI